MPKQKQLKFDRRIFILCLAMILIIIGLLIIRSYQIKKLPKTGPVIPTPSVVADMTIRGKIMCLPHKNQSGPQTMECAYGLKADGGVYYALSDKDPMYKNLSSVAMNKNVEVTGSIKLNSDTKYDTIGTIYITSIKQL